MAVDQNVSLRYRNKMPTIERCYSLRRRNDCYVSSYTLHSPPPKKTTFLLSVNYYYLSLPKCLLNNQSNWLRAVTELCNRSSSINGHIASSSATLST